MRKSEIFESFIKIAQDKGLISEDAPEKAIKQLSKTHRHDSLSADDIAKLYNTKADRPKSMDYDRNIIEDAHPDLVVVSPSYDKLNGLVGNLNQKQDMNLNKVNKAPNGQLDNHKWAKRDLLLTLVRVGNDLDNKNKEELRSLSDHCLNQISAPLKKEAVPAIPVILGIAALFGVLYAQQHMSFSNEGLQQNSEKLLSEIDDLITSNSNWGVGVSYKPEFVQEMENFKSKVTELTAAANTAEEHISQVEKPRDASEINQAIAKPEVGSATTAYNNLRAKITQFTPYFRKILADFSNEGYKQRQVVDKGLLTSLVDKTQVLSGGKGLVADNFDDVRRALAPFRQSYIDIVKVLREAGSLQKKLQAELEASKTEDSATAGETPAPPSGAKHELSPENSKAVEELAKQFPQ